MQTVREQLAEALERLLNEADVPEAHADCLSTESGPCNCVFARGREALDRHRAESEGDYHDGYQDGLEAQRERVGGGTA